MILRVALSALEELLPQDKRAVVAKLRAKVSSLFNAEVPQDALFYQGDPSKEKMRLISKSIEQGTKLEITYLNPLRQDRSVRKISIQRVKAEPKRTLIEAWCDSSKGIRTFNLAQIEKIVETDEKVTIADEEEQDNRVLATIKANADSYFVSENQAQLKLTDKGYEIEIFQPEWLVRKVLAEAGMAKLLAPQDMAKRVSELANKALALYR